jgi:hypothetical protein
MMLRLPTRSLIVARPAVVLNPIATLNGLYEIARVFNYFTKVARRSADPHVFRHEPNDHSYDAAAK